MSCQDKPSAVSAPPNCLTFKYPLEVCLCVSFCCGSSSGESCYLGHYRTHRCHWQHQQNILEGTCAATALGAPVAWVIRTTEYQCWRNQRSKCLSQSGTSLPFYLCATSRAELSRWHSEGSEPAQESHSFCFTEVCATPNLCHSL